MLDIIAFDDRTQKHPNDVQLPPWLPKHEFLMLIVAPAGSGKTTLLLNIVLRIYSKYWQRILIFSPTIHNDAKWEHVRNASNVLMPSDKQAKREGNKQTTEDEKNKASKKEKHVSFKEPEDDKDWCVSAEVDDIMQLKENQIIDPFANSAKHAKKQRRIGLSKEWYERAIGINTENDSDDIENTKRIYINEKKVQREKLLNKNQRMNKLSAILVKPPVPEMHKQLKDMTKSVFNDKSRKPSHSKSKKKEPAKVHFESKEPVISGLDEEGSGKIHEDDMFEEYEEDTLKTIMDEIDEQVKEAGGDKKKLVDCVDRSLWLFDDMVGSGLFSNKRNNAFKRLTVRRRHYYSSLIGVTQAYKEIPKTTRTNANAIILFRIDSDEELQTIYREYPMGLKLKDWLKIVEYCTCEPYTFAMFNLQTSDINHRIVRNFDEPLSLERQASILGHAPREDMYTDESEESDDDDNVY